MSDPKPPPPEDVRELSAKLERMHHITIGETNRRFIRQAATALTALSAERDNAIAYRDRYKRQWMECATKAEAERDALLARAEGAERDADAMDQHAAKETLARLAAEASLSVAREALESIARLTSGSNRLADYPEIRTASEALARLSPSCEPKD